MTNRTATARPEPDKELERRKAKEHLNDLLDEGLKQTFPASDPPAVVSPGHEIPTRERNKADG